MGARKKVYLEIVRPQSETNLLTSIDVDAKNAHGADALLAFGRHLTQLSHLPAVLSHHVRNAWVCCQLVE